jgi:hypothetical protein
MRVIIILVYLLIPHVAKAEINLELQKELLAIKIWWLLIE